MTNENLYGFTTSDEVKLDAQGLPIGTYKAVIASESPDEKDGVIRGIILEWEILEGVNKGRTGKQWLLTLAQQHFVKTTDIQDKASEEYKTALTKATTTSTVAQQTIKRIADASGAAVGGAAPLKGRVLTLEVGEQKKNPAYTEIKKYLPADYVKAPF